MRKVEHRLRLDLLRGGNQGYIRVKRGENGARRLAIALYMHSVPYMADAGTTAVFRAIKPDNTQLFNSATITDNVVTVGLTTQTVAALGTVRCELSIYGMNNELLYSPQFDVIVEDYLYSDTAIESTNEYTNLTEALSTVNNIVSTEAARVAAENQRVANENARVSAEAERASAETARAAAENARVSAEAERASAETERTAAEDIRVKAEENRISDEDGRAANEALRIANETTRNNNETSRISAENGRVTAESGRVSAETARAEAEESRATLYAEWNGLTVEAQDGDAADAELNDVSGHKNILFTLPRGKGFTVLGQFMTLEALQSAVTTPKGGDAYGVGSTAPYDIYIWDKVENKWKNHGKLQGPQSDWNQNDDTQPDYVKNRPFYTGDPVETVFVEESTVTFAENSGLYVAQIQSSFAATIGKTYKVYWDGAAYECACVNFDGGPTIGNLSIIGAGSDTGEPFVMAISNGRRIEIGTADTSASHTISISRLVSEVVKIDEKYLPELPYMDKVNPTGTGAFSLNRKADTTIGNYSFAEGHKTTASGMASHAEGFYTTASGDCSHAEGNGPTASGESSHAEGTNTTASGDYSHAEGHKTTASGIASHAEGYGTKASSKYQHVHGKYNIEDKSNTYAEIVGNGEQLENSNAHTLDWSGNAWYAGTVEGKALILPSSTSDSTKKFRITVDDSGVPTITDESDSTNTWKPTNLPTVTSSDSGKFLRVSDTGEWVAEMQDGSATDTVVTASASAWSNNTITLPVTGVMADSKLEIGLSNTATDEQFTAAVAAQIRATSSGDGTVTLKAVTVPSVDLPILIRRFS